jgi:hypothetical protein
VSRYANNSHTHTLEDYKSVIFAYSKRKSIHIRVRGPVVAVSSHYHLESTLTLHHYFASILGAILTTAITHTHALTDTRTHTHTDALTHALTHSNQVPLYLSLHSSLHYLLTHSTCQCIMYSSHTDISVTLWTPGDSSTYSRCTLEECHTSHLLSS